MKNLSGGHMFVFKLGIVNCSYFADAKLFQLSSHRVIHGVVLFHTDVTQNHHIEHSCHSIRSKSIATSVFVGCIFFTRDYLCLSCF